jgi:hypothetical protein
MSSDGFQVFLAQLLKASSAFDEQSGVLNAVMPGNGPACPDGGSADINHAMQGAAGLLGLLHANLATVIGQHGTRLLAAHKIYSVTEKNLSQIATDITVPGAV